MSYPPPNPDAYAINGYKFFRLNTPLISDGDVYESQQGAQGFAIGPDSDVSKVNIAYFDDQVPNFLNQIAITPERPFPGMIAAQNDKTYAPANTPGRILIWSDELYNPTWDPNFIDISGRIDFEVPVMDVVQYFAPAGNAMNSGRNDKEYWYDFLNAPPGIAGATNAWTIVIPYYGRRYFHMEFISDAAGGQIAQIDVSILGLTYKPGNANNAAIAYPLIDDGPAAGFASVAVASGQRLNVVILSSTKSTGLSKTVGNDPTGQVVQVAAGMFDALAISFNTPSADGIKSTAQNTVRIRCSDRENG